MAGEKTEAPTPKRLKDARQKGNVAKSEEVVQIGALLVAVVGIRLLGPNLWWSMRDLLHEGLGNPTQQELTRQSAQQYGRDTFQLALMALLPLLGLIAIAGVLFNLAQTGILLSGNGLKPNFSRVNPGAGLKRMVSVEGLVRLGKSLFKFAVVAVVVYFTLAGQMAEIASLAQFAVPDATRRLARLGFDVAIRATAALFIMALADYGWQRRQHLKRLMMTKEELKQEMKENDGDPQIKAAIRRRRQQLMNRMIAAVKTADVVVTNPTHFAVALKYDPVSMQAPMVVAKGLVPLAHPIRDVAMKAGVPVLEEPPHGRAGDHQLGAHAVAEVLAWVYALRAKKPFTRRRMAAANLGGNL